MMMLPKSFEDENKDEAGNLDHVDDGEKLLHRWILALLEVRVCSCYDPGVEIYEDDNPDDFDGDGDDGLPAYSHNEKIPPWWGNVSNDKGGNVSNSHHTW